MFPKKLGNGRGKVENGSFKPFHCQGPPKKGHLGLKEPRCCSQGKVSLKKNRFGKGEGNAGIFFPRKFLRGFPNWVPGLLGTIFLATVNFLPEEI